MRVAPAAQSASISRSTMGKGAFAPAPVSSSGAAPMAHISFCSWAGLLMVAVMAVLRACHDSRVSHGSVSGLNLSQWKSSGEEDDERVERYFPAVGPSS